MGKNILIEASKNAGSDNLQPLLAPLNPKKKIAEKVLQALEVDSEGRVGLRMSSESGGTDGQGLLYLKIDGVPIVAACGLKNCGVR